MKLKNKIKLDPRLNFIKDPIFIVAVAIFSIFIGIYYYFSFDKEIKDMDWDKIETVK
jgi:ascorbate-specific PTS system EIIC-type component UlaA